MAGPHDKAGRPSSGIDYEIGYGRPPKERRFKPGKSGNPKGRPNRKLDPSVEELKWEVQPTNRMFTDKAYRMVTITEGGRKIKLPAIQAMLRTMFLGAIKGDRFKQNAINQMLTRLEQEDYDKRMEQIKWAAEYKQGWIENFKMAEENGWPMPEPLPHPDDIEIDLDRITIDFTGPTMPEELDRVNRLLKARDDIQTEFLFHKSDMEAAAEESDRALCLRHVIFNQKRFDYINDNVPKRLRVALVGRIYHPDASLSGDYVGGKRPEW